MAIKLTARDNKLIDSLVEEYVKEQHSVKAFLDQILTMLRESSELEPHIHSIKYRLKDPEHLRDKLGRKLKKAKEEKVDFTISKDNLFERINDLAGVRILHLYTAQIESLHPQIIKETKEKNFELMEKPFARTWDLESKSYFEELGFVTQDSATMYTSVHYVIGSNSRFKATCEIQVRTLSEELWGEVDHKLNYPHESDVLACKEQLKVLARVTSSASRLVDSIFRSAQEYNNEIPLSLPKPKAKAKKKSTRKARG